MAKVFVGLSGGVDSAVSAALLKEQGHDVVGVFIKIWQPEFIECTWKQDRLDAVRVCAALNIPFRELDLSEIYKKNVIDKMIADYAAGRTPNPDVLCNREIKFGAFAAWAKENAAHKIATGHYARIGEEGGHFKLLRGADPQKDQSYFLYRLTQGDLSHTLFPVGGLLKSEVRKLAQKFELPVAHKPDSQGLCFVGDVSMKDFLKRYITVGDGDVVDGAGTIIGRHEGALLYTRGQRHGFGSQKGPYYVVEVDVQKNVLRVSKNRADAAVSLVALTDRHWIHHEPNLPLTINAQARYREEPVAVTLSRDKKGALLAAFAPPHIAARGQSLVLYDGETCLGGAVIG